MRADTRPAVKRNLDIEQCLSFTIRGEWGHFRRIDGNVVKQTYRVMPRTTVAGLIAAMLGLERDSYYERFAPDVSAISVQPQFDYRTMNLPENVLTTSKGKMDTVPSGRGKKPLEISAPDSSEPRQQHNFEMLVEPKYRIDCWFDDEELYDNLQQKLTERRFEYAPSLGLSECLATVHYNGEFDVETTPSLKVDSAVPCGTGGIKPESGTQYGMERSPGFMTTESSQNRRKRKTTGFINWVFSEDTLELTDSIASNVDGRNVVFV